MYKVEMSMSDEHDTRITDNICDWAAVTANNNTTHKHRHCEYYDDK